VSRGSVAPGPRSLEGLEWLARVGASPLEPWGLVMGWRRAAAYDHARRLAAAGLVRTVRMTQGDGSLFVATAAGAARVGYPASWAVRSIGPSNWAHATVCAWVSAWLQRRGHSWWSDREIAGDVFWQRSVRYRDHRGTARVTHRPDLAVELSAGPAAIEVEVQRKSRARLLAILRMYAEIIDESDDPLAGLLYVCARVDIAKAIRHAAWDAGLAEGPTLSVRTRDEVVGEARAAATSSA
jgi:hypothetical protein